MSPSTLLSAIAAAFKAAKPYILWLLANYGTYAATISAVAAALTTLLSGDTSGGVRQLMQVLTVILTGGAAVGLTYHAKASQAAGQAVLASRPSRSK